MRPHPPRDPKTNPSTGMNVDRLLKKGDLVFDIGAHNGEYTEQYLSLGCRVIAVEPQLNELQGLMERFSGRNLPVTIVPFAISNTFKEMELHICETASSLSTFNERRINEGRFSPATPYEPYGVYRWTRIEYIECKTIDWLIEKYGKPAFCKIDVEGHELQAVQGLTQVLPLLSFEYEIEFIDLVPPIAAHLLSVGNYEFNHCVDLWPDLALEQWGSIDTVISDIHMRAKRDFADMWGDIYARPKS